MSPHTNMPNGSRFRGHGAAGQEAFFNALHKTGYPNQGHSASPGLRIYVTGPNGKKCAGYIITEGGRRILQKTKVRAVHYCVKHGGYGVELDALKQAARLNVELVRLVFDSEDKILETRLRSFAERGILDTLGGFGEQVFLPLHFWRDLRDPQGVLGEV